MNSQPMQWLKLIGGLFLMGVFVRVLFGAPLNLSLIAGVAGAVTVWVLCWVFLARYIRRTRGIPPDDEEQDQP
jgi:hypothetical protein